MAWTASNASRNASQSSASRSFSAGSSGPFCTSAVNSNPNFRPARICVAPMDNVSAKAPKPPEKPLMPYMRYSRRMWERVRATHPESKFWEIGKIIGKMWRELPDKEKQGYCDEYEVEKVEYEKQMTAYHNSAAFQNYLAQKTREKSDSVPPSLYYDYQGVYVQPLDEETDDTEVNSHRYYVSERYARNQKVMAEIMSNVAIPDLRTVVTTERVNVLRSQVTSLTQHQATLENEYNQLVENCEKKKRRIEESRTWFDKRMKEVGDEKPILTEALFQELTDKWVKQYVEAFEKFKQRQQQALESRNVGPLSPSRNVAEEDKKEEPKQHTEEAYSDHSVSSVEDTVADGEKNAEATSLRTTERNTDSRSSEASTAEDETEAVLAMAEEEEEEEEEKEVEKTEDNLKEENVAEKEEEEEKVSCVEVVAVPQDEEMECQSGENSPIQEDSSAQETQPEDPEQTCAEEVLPEEGTDVKGEEAEKE